MVVSREHLQISLEKIRQDIADLERPTIPPSPPYEWMLRARVERIAHLKSVAAKVEAMIAAIETAM